MKKIAVVNDISGFGRCSLTAAIPIISTLGIQCCPLPTAVLSNQTGYNSFHCIDLTTEMQKYLHEWDKLGYKFDAVLTGYLTCATQADLIIEFVKKARLSGAMIVVDPVMADDGKIYHTYTKALCKKVAQLVGLADVITPNLTELCILAQRSYKEILLNEKSDDFFKMIAESASALLNDRLRTVIVTGVKKNNCVCNVIVSNDGFKVTQTELCGGSFSGTGDIFASIVCAEITKGMSVSYAVELASKFIEKSIKDTLKYESDRNDGINFEKYLRMITDE